MSKFLFIYRNDPAIRGKLTPEEREAQMQKWRIWLGQGVQQGWLVDPGDALKPEGRVVNPKRAVIDGPFVESKEILGGYSIVRAESLDGAAEHAQGCPCLLAGGTVEVRQLEGFTLER
jgi:hypothetical protein